MVEERIAQPLLDDLAGAVPAAFDALFQAAPRAAIRGRIFGGVLACQSG